MISIEQIRSDVEHLQEAISCLENVEGVSGIVDQLEAKVEVYEEIIYKLLHARNPWLYNEQDRVYLDEYPQPVHTAIYGDEEYFIS